MNAPIRVDVVTPEQKAAEGLALLLLPALYFPGLMMWRTWQYVDAQNPDWHPLLKLLPSLGEFVGLIIILHQFYRIVPKSVAGVVTAAYLAFAYG